MTIGAGSAASSAPTVAHAAAAARAHVALYAASGRRSACAGAHDDGFSANGGNAAASQPAHDGACSWSARRSPGDGCTSFT